MIQLVTIDCWDTLLRNTDVWDPLLIAIASKIFRSTDSAATEAITARAFREEGAEFSKILAEKMITIPIKERLRNLAFYAGVQLREEALEELRLAFDDAILAVSADRLYGFERFILQNIGTRSLKWL